MTIRCPHCGHEMVGKNYRRFGGLTAAQFDTLEFIRSHIEEHRVSPTFAEIEEGLGLHSRSGVSRLVHGLEERGAIRRLPNRARSIQLVEAA